jgi:hypothetical protein
MVKAKMVLEDVGVGKNDVKTWTIQEYSLICSNIKL